MNFNLFKKEYFLYTLCSVCFMLLLLLFSYKMVMAATDFTPAQEAWMKYFAGGEVPSGYIELEIAHMQDVQTVMQFMQYVFYAILLIVTIILTRHKREKETILKLLRYGSLTTILGIGLLLFLSIVAFNGLFAVFHEVFFPQGNWQFPVDSLLIQAWPLNFFVRKGVQIFGLAFLLGVVLWIVTKRGNSSRKKMF